MSCRIYHYLKTFSTSDPRKGLKIAGKYFHLTYKYDILEPLVEEESHPFPLSLQKGVGGHGGPHPDPLDVRRIDLSTPRDSTTCLFFQNATNTLSLDNIYSDQLYVSIRYVLTNLYCVNFESFTHNFMPI